MGDIVFKKNINDLLPTKPPISGIAKEAMDQFRLIRLVNDIYMVLDAATISGSGIDTSIPERVWWGS